MCIGEGQVQAGLLTRGLGVGCSRGGSMCYVHFFLREELLALEGQLSLLLAIDAAMIFHVLFHQSEFWSSISSSLHFHDCSS